MDLSLMHSVGNLKLLSLHKVAFLCSRHCPAAVRERAVAWAARERERGTCVLSGFHSSIEKEVLQQLLKGTQPLVVVLARGFGRALQEDFDVPLAEGRLLLLTRYAESVTHASEESCYQRNRLMIEVAEETVVGYAAPGGKLERLVRDFAALKPIHFLEEHSPPAPSTEPPKPLPADLIS
ncbi:DNA-processing protein DprA [Geomonas sp. RF6]|uniref:DNA-processing protein DprA n=1 Tax=Geomonas sp. RF6 TaxID=2897342 RepID=UPI001E2B6FB6|nr:DNA-processing protein DprA [Geomonas sp. RF6]UFS72315.1 DNA-processing protein DprA [Geomonas sp. RF6]